MRASLTIALLGLATSSVMAQTPFDGQWNVTIQTRAGSCDPTAIYALTIADGKVSGSNASGTVGTSGVVRVSVGAAYASGYLAGRKGSGKWNAASAGVPCSGRWEASKQ